MSESAFGIDHGAGSEVSKAGPMGFVKQIGRSYADGAKMLGGLAGGGVQRAGMGMARAGDARGGMLGGAMTKTGLAGSRTGAAMQKRPGLTGAGIAGATAVPGAMAANKLKQTKPKMPGRI